MVWYRTSRANSFWTTTLHYWRCFTLLEMLRLQRWWWLALWSLTYFTWPINSFWTTTLHYWKRFTLLETFRSQWWWWLALWQLDLIYPDPLTHSGSLMWKLVTANSVCMKSPCQFGVWFTVLKVETLYFFHLVTRKNCIVTAATGRQRQW